jgi:hypothetical protein
MPMPETAMDEDRDLPGNDHDVGPPRQIATMEPKPNAEPMELTADDAFGRRVLPANGGHDAGTFGGRDSVHRKSTTIRNTNLH